LTCINQSILDYLNTSLIEYLQTSNNFEKLEEYYSKDSEPNDNNIGHISADNQEKILENSKFLITDENYKKNILLHNFYDGTNINCKQVIDFYLLITYFYDFIIPLTH